MGNKTKFKETEIGKIPEDWGILSIKQLISESILDKPLDGNHGNIHPKGSDFVSEGIPFIMASDIANGKVNYQSCKYITKTQADSLKKGFAKKGDVLLTHKATIGRTAVVENIDDYIMLTPQVTYYRIKSKNRLNRYYLKYYFDYSKFQKLFSSWAGSGSTRAYLGITEQKKLPVISILAIYLFDDIFYGKIGYKAIDEIAL